MFRAHPFYFGSSSKLLRKLFTPPLTRKALTAKPPAYGYLGDATDIVLAEGMSKASAADIARIVMDDVAWREAYSIGHSLLLTGANGVTRRNPFCNFPFKGVTRLQASGRWLPFGGQANQTFIVYSLRSCTAPFPFKALRYSVKNGRTADRRNEVPTNEDGNTQLGRVGPSVRVGSQLSDQDPSSTLAPKTIFVRGDKFPDLHDKPVRQRATLLPTSPHR